MKKRVVCIGTGLAALNLALHLGDDVELIMVSPADQRACNSYLAKGGIAVPVTDEDIEIHVRDTLKAGGGLCDEDVVKDLVSAAPDMLKTLEAQGVVFENHQALEGGHSRPRVRHKADETGKYVTLHVSELTRNKSGIHHLNGHQAIELLTNDKRCYGVLLADLKNSRMVEMHADAVVLASGGCGGLYLHHSNSSASNGEGLALASSAGAEVRDMEFIQFHPTMLYRYDHPLLITEAFRGAGAILTDNNGVRFMNEVHPLGSLAPRDIISRTMFELMQTHGYRHLWLEFECVEKEEMKSHFPALMRLFKEMELTANRIPVTPAAHYQCGGVCTNTQGETSVTDLYAIGEVARTGLHGGNRLASNSLMELLIISERVAKKLNQVGERHIPLIRTSSAVFSKSLQMDVCLFELKHILWDSFGIVRNPIGMKKGLERIEILKRNLHFLHAKKPDDISVRVALNRMEAALYIAIQAIARKESAGCHYVKEKDAALINTPLDAVEIAS